MNKNELNSHSSAVMKLEVGVRRVLAPNPSPMTFRGTNTYIIGTDQVAVIDPGPADPSHLQAIQDALDPGETISHIFVTHSHLDHSPLAEHLASATGAAVFAFGNSRAGRSKLMTELALTGLTGGGEGVDVNFARYESLSDGATITSRDWELTALWTPGHFCNHLSFAYGNAVFTGDQIMGWASTMVSPPDGDLDAFMTSTAKLAARADRVFYPGHGDPIHNPAERAQWLIDHRRNREREILTILAEFEMTIPALTRALYTDTPPQLLPAAARNVFAHLIDLHQKKRVNADPGLGLNAMYSTYNAK